MRFAIWTYPWDVLDLGLDAVVRDIRDRAGLDGINLATSYHAGRFFQPRSPRRKSYFPEDGTIYFQPDPKLWAGSVIVPKVAGLLAEGDVLRDLIRQRDTTGLAVTCWTVCLHNTRLGLLHPDACVRNAFGDSHYYSLCPSHPDVRRYAATLVRDLTHSYRPDIVQLETPGFMAYGHGYHHEKDGVGLTAEDDLLLSLCFCDACIAGASAAKVDARAAQRTVCRWVEESAAREIPMPRWPDLAHRGPEVFRGHAEVEAYVLWRFKVVESLMERIRAEAHPATRIEVIDDGWRSGVDVATLGRHCDGVVACAYDRAPAEVAAAIAAVRQVLPAQCHLGAGLRLFYPEMTSARDLADRTLAAIEAGARDLHYYNYGLVPAARLDWIRAAVDATKGRRA